MNKIQQDFPIFSTNVSNKNLIYLDSSSTTHKPKIVIKAITDFYSKYNSNVHRGVHTLSEKATIAYEKAHVVVADFIGAASDEVVFTSSTTQSINMLCWGLAKDIKKGDEIVLSLMEHHSNLVPWQQLAKQKGAVLKFIPITEEYRLDMIKAKELIGPRTKIVSVTHISNTLGTVNQVKELAELAHSVGAIMVVDGAQSVPHIKVNVQELNCDFLAFSGHKMCGPTGIGVLYGKKELLEKLDPTVFGGGMIREVTLEGSTWNDLPYRLEAGTPNIAGAIGLAAAIEYLQNIGMDNVEEEMLKITEYGLEKLGQVEGLTLIGPKEVKNRAPIFSFTLKGMHPHDVCQLLDGKGIATRGGTHCTMPLMKELGLSGTTRASFYIYNTTEDVDVLVSALEEIKGTFK